MKMLEPMRRSTVRIPIGYVGNFKLRNYRTVDWFGDWLGRSLLSYWALGTPHVMLRVVERRCVPICKEGEASPSIHLQLRSG
jgi:hypothetical protein